MYKTTAPNAATHSNAIPAEHTIPQTNLYCNPKHRSTVLGNGTQYPLQNVIVDYDMQQTQSIEVAIEGH